MRLFRTTNYAASAAPEPPHPMARWGRRRDVGGADNTPVWQAPATKPTRPYRHPQTMTASAPAKNSIARAKVRHSQSPTALDFKTTTPAASAAPEPPHPMARWVRRRDAGGADNTPVWQAPATKPTRPYRHLKTKTASATTNNSTARAVTPPTHNQPRHKKKKPPEGG